MPIPILSVAQMRAWEKATWATGQTESAVIVHAGMAVARQALQMTRSGEVILILAGPGNNGADARMVRPHCGDRRVHLLEIVQPMEAWSALLALLQQTKPALIIDGLFGLGLNRPLDESWVRLVHHLNETQITILSVDVPSGLDADSGEPKGAAIRATATLTLGAAKRGLVQSKALPFTGQLRVAEDIGLIPCPFETETAWTAPADFSGYPPGRPAGGHKGTFGHLVILAGSLGYHGAAVLAARGALRARPGLVTVRPQENVYLPVAGQLQAAMVTPWRSGLKYPPATTAILLGPGLASEGLPESLQAEARQIWHDQPLPVIVDASALDWLTVGLFSKTGALRVLTPHPGEAARMLKSTVAKVEADRPAALRELSKRWGNCWVVLKGNQTLVGGSTGGIFVNSSGNTGLAQGGTGDVLAGYLAGLLAQPRLQADPLKAIRYAVWQHGASADELSGRRGSWGVEELLGALGNA